MLRRRPLPSMILCGEPSSRNGKGRGGGLVVRSRSNEWAEAGFECSGANDFIVST